MSGKSNEFSTQCLLRKLTLELHFREFNVKPFQVDISTSTGSVNNAFSATDNIDKDGAFKHIVNTMKDRNYLSI